MQTHEQVRQCPRPDDHRHCDAKPGRAEERADDGRHDGKETALQERNSVSSEFRSRTSAETDVSGAIENDKEDEGHDGLADGPNREERDGVDDERQDEDVKWTKAIGRGAEAEPPN